MSLMKKSSRGENRGQTPKLDYLIIIRYSAPGAGYLK
jgi:hypothetical protein